MKKKVLRVICGVLAAVTLVSYASCGESEPQSYVIQYSDERGAHTISVVEGDVFSLEEIPQKYGYEFIGLFDSETGGKQYVDANGSSLVTFEAERNLILFPHWKPRSYTVVLDYQGAKETDITSFKVSYGSEVTVLPNNLVKPSQEFTGWYTEANQEGVQISDRNGVLPTKGKITENNFDLDSQDGRIYLYAGFKTAEYNVTLYFGTKQEKIKVEHGTDIKNITYENPLNGYPVSVWSTTSDDVSHSNVFTGKITKDICLYATEYVDKGIYFDSNGGSKIEPITEEAGAPITLPTPTREGYLFAGWYASDQQKVELSYMPDQPLILTAGWYKIKNSKQIVFIQSTETHYVTTSIFWGDETYQPSLKNLCYEFNYGDFGQSNQKIPVRIKGHVKIKQGASSTITGYADFYSKKEISTANLLHTQIFDGVTNSYKSFDFTLDLTVQANFYACFYLSKEENLYLQDFCCTVEYPDTQTLHL